MPKVEASWSDLAGLVGREEGLEDLMMLGKAELDERDGDRIKIDFKDTNRPDLWCVEGLARQIRYKLGDRLSLPKVKESSFKVIVSEEMKEHRPYTASFVAKGIEWTEESLSSFIQFQEKLAGTFGLNRKEVAIGAYNLAKIDWPIHFRMESMRFAPLGFEEEMEPEEILEKHPKGREYGHLLKRIGKYPMFVDSSDNVLSMPPIINSEHTGKVTLRTKDIFVEASGFNLEKVMFAVQVMALALEMRGAEIWRVETIYSDFSISTPEFGFQEMEIDLGRIVEFSGLELTQEEAKQLLEEYGYIVEEGRVRYPSWRRDIMHWRDVAEDLLISYGYNRINPEIPKISTVGGNSEETEREFLYREAMLGLGFQEIMTFVLSSPGKEGIMGDDFAEIENPVSSTFSCLRANLLPSLLEFEAKNQDKEYPHYIFESGDVVRIDEAAETRTRTEKRIGCLISHPRAGYGEISGCLARLMKMMGLDFRIEEDEMPWMIPGRAGKILAGGREIGFIGEVHPRVLEKFGIQMPVAYFEIVQV